MRRDELTELHFITPMRIYLAFYATEFSHTIGQNWDRSEAKFSLLLSLRRVFKIFVREFTSLGDAIYMNMQTSISAPETQ